MIKKPRMLPAMSRKKLEILLLSIVGTVNLVFLSLLLPQHLREIALEREVEPAADGLMVVTTPPANSPSLSVAPLAIVLCRGHDAVNMSKKEAENLTDQENAHRLDGLWDRQKEQLTTLLKTLLYFSKAPTWRILVLTDTLETFQEVVHLSEAFPSSHVSRLRLEHYPIYIPSEHALDWRPCAWAKLYLAEALPQEEAVIFLDTDIIFLGPGEELYWLLNSLDEKQALSFSPEPQYVKESNPRDYAGAVGINTGVMAANLTRLRKLPGGSLGAAIQKLGPIKPEPRHDQDAVNFFLKKNPKLLMEVSSRWNFLPSACYREAPDCQDCAVAGILVLHGADTSFYRQVDLKFMAVSKAFSSISLDESPHQLLSEIKEKFNEIDSSSKDFGICSNYSNFDNQLLLNLEKFVHDEEKVECPFLAELLLPGEGLTRSNCETLHNLLIEDLVGW